MLHGEQDETCPLDLAAQPTAALVPSAQLTVYEGAPPGLFLTHMAQLNADLLASARGT